MVPLLMYSAREDNPASSMEEFGTHLSLYDDTFHFLEKPVPTSITAASSKEDVKGPLPPSVFCPASKKSDDATGQVKVKRKCGRPRNPIPRHKRVSHINAEHRRRGKIQDGFRTLKNIVPKYEQTTGRDSKADILFKAVDHCRLLQRDISEIKSSIETLKLEKEALSAEVKNYSEVVSETTVQEEGMPTLEDRYTDYVHHKAKEMWTFSAFKDIMRPLWDTYKLSVRSGSMDEFLRSVTDWAAGALSFSNLRSACHGALRDGPAETYGPVSGQKEAILSDGGHYGPGGFMAPLGTEGNNHCLNSLAFSTEHQFGCRDGAGSACSSVGAAASGGGGVAASAGGGEAVGVGAEGAHSTSHLGSLPRAMPHTAMSHHQDLVSFTNNSAHGNNAHGNSTNNNPLGELYLNLDQDLHYHHHMGLPAALDPWQHHRFQPHHHHQQLSHNDYYAHMNHFHDIKKPQPVWGNAHHSVTGELNPRHSTYHPHHNMFGDRDFKHELSRPHEPPASLSAHTQRTGLGYSSHYEHHAHRRLSRSSSESEGSVLNMGTFVKQATETLTDQDKYGQLSPSTESCVSPGSSVYLGSPGAMNTRGDPAFSSRTSNLDHFMQHRSAIQDRMDSSVGHNWTAPRLSMSLPSYRETFGPRTMDYHRHSIAGCESEVRPHWGGDASENLLNKGSGHSQAHMDRFESSSLLAELLSHHNNPPMPPPKSVRGLPDHSTARSSETFFASSAQTSDHQINGTVIGSTRPGDQSAAAFSGLIKQGNNHLSLSYADQTNHRRAEHSAGQPSFSPSSDRQLEERRMSNPCSDKTNDMSTIKDPDVKPCTSPVSSTAWSQVEQMKLSSNSVQAGKNQKELQTHDSKQKTVCYFEMAHQQLLKTQRLPGRINHTEEVTPSQSSLSPEHDRFSTSRGVLHSRRHSSDLACGTTSPPVTVETVSLFSQQPSRVSVNTASSLGSRNGDDRVSLPRVGRKSSFEGSFPEDNNSFTDMSGCKRSCHWPPLCENRDECDFSKSAHDKPASALLSRESESDCMDKSLLATLGETTIRF